MSFVRFSSYSIKLLLKLNKQLYSFPRMFTFSLGNFDCAALLSFVYEKSRYLNQSEVCQGLL